MKIDLTSFGDEQMFLVRLLVIWHLEDSATLVFLGLWIIGSHTISRMTRG